MAAESNKVTAPPQSPVKTVQAILEQGRSEIEKSLPKFIRSEYFITTAITEVMNNEELHKCDPLSVCIAIKKSAQLGLVVGGTLGQAYLVPFFNKKSGKLECQLIPGYRGQVNLVRRSGEVSAFYAAAAYKGDDFDYEIGTDPFIHHKPRNESIDITHVYAVCKMKDGSVQFEVLTLKQVEDHRDRYAGQPQGRAWKGSFEEMAKKTAVRRLIKMLPIAIEMGDEQYQDDEPQEVNPDKFKQISMAPNVIPQGDRAIYLKQIDALMTEAAQKEKSLAGIIPEDLDDLPADRLVTIVAQIKAVLNG